MKQFAIITIFFLLPLGEAGRGHAQSDWQQYYQMIADNVNDDPSISSGQAEDDDENNLSEIYEALSEAAASPINLNAITREDLEGLICFSEMQIDAVLEYVQHYAPIRTKAELQMIPLLDTAHRGLLGCLTYLGDCPPKERTPLDSIKYASAITANQQYYMPQNRGEIVAFARIPLYSRKGDDGAYQGGRIKNWLRASYVINSHIKVGFVAAQDAGEPFFKGKKNYGYDFYSGYIQLQRFGVLKKMVIGRYRIKSGLGLILNNNYSFGKLFSIASFQSSAVSIRPHSSRSEGNFLQGATATFSLSKQIEATVFGSYRMIDATLSKDSTGIATIVRTGYHRTETEIDKKHNASEAAGGINIRFTAGNFHVGATALFDHYSKPLLPYTEGSSNYYLYRRFYASGSDFWNVSIDYGYRLGKLLRFEGETATGDCKQIATVNTLSWLATGKLNLMLIQRYYPYKFYSTMGRSFSEGGSNQDESGVYVGATWDPSSRFSLTAYTDIAYFVWPKYQALGSSHSFDNLVQVTFRTSSHSFITTRYRLKCREKNGEEDGELIYKNEHRLRLTYTLQSGRLTWKTQFDGACCKYKDSELGGMLSSNAIYSMKRIKLCGGLGYFNTEGYNARVYTYEQSTPYNLSCPVFYGKGMRVYALAQADLIKKLSLFVKCGLTHYFDRDVIGTSYQQINSSTQTDLDIMLRYKF